MVVCDLKSLLATAACAGSDIILSAKKQYFTDTFGSLVCYYVPDDHDIFQFDDGVEGLVPFLMERTCPMVAANLDISSQPELRY